jgi:hypothetical protein
LNPSEDTQIETHQIIACGNSRKEKNRKKDLQQRESPEMGLGEPTESRGSSGRRMDDLPGCAVDQSDAREE